MSEQELSIILSKLGFAPELEDDLRIIARGKMQRYITIKKPSQRWSAERQEWLKLPPLAKAACALKKILAYQPSENPTEVTFDTVEELIQDTANHYRDLESRSSSDD
jgi:hypothetical protein